MAKEPIIEVCHGPRCGDYGGRALAECLALKGISFEKLDCQSLCPHAPIVRIDGVAKLKAGVHLFSDYNTPRKSDDKILSLIPF